jgi:hypothetical protein
MAASVYSATGTALAATALVTRMPRRHTASSRKPLTLPARWAISAASACAPPLPASTGGQPQLVISTSSARRAPRRALEAAQGLPADQGDGASRRSRWSSRISSSRTTGCMTSAVRSILAMPEEYPIIPAVSARRHRTGRRDARRRLPAQDMVPPWRACRRPTTVRCIPSGAPRVTLLSRGVGGVRRAARPFRLEVVETPVAGCRSGEARVVDIWHFGLSDLMRADALTETVTRALMAAVAGCRRRRRRRRRAFRVGGGGAGPADPVATAPSPWSRSWRARELPLPLPELFRLYVGKNVLNHFRQDHGYKTGSTARPGTAARTMPIWWRRWKPGLRRRRCRSSSTRRSPSAIPGRD